jgi:YD repeat-containing protein
MLITRRTDLFIPDSIPLTVTRCYRLWDDRTLPFGTRTNHAWDLAPFGSRQPYTYADVVFCDGKHVHYNRISKGTGYADAVYEHRETATPFYESRFSWNGNGWDLRLKDGTLYLFPEAYYAKRPVEGAIVGMRGAGGNSVKVERTRKRDLQRITSPSGHWIAFDVDPSGHIVKAEDDSRRAVNYTYDAAGRLVVVEAPRGTTRYAYDLAQLVAIEENGKKLVDFGYRNGRIAQVSFRNDRTYRFRYEFDQNGARRLIRTFVQSPDGKVTKVDIPPPVR